jgi:hypothetical protein
MAGRRAMAPWPRAQEFATAMAPVAVLHGGEKRPRRGVRGQREGGGAAGGAGLAREGTEA